MRARLVRQRLARPAAAMMALSAVVACTACGLSTDDSNDTPPIQTGYVAGMVAVSNGTDKVDIGGRKVTFPTTVTDATWSPDGSRLAFVDRDGNIATAHPDGTGLLVLTSPGSSVIRSRPAWVGAEVVFGEKDTTGRSRVMAVYANGGASATQPAEHVAELGSPVGSDDSTPSASADLGKGQEMAFQRRGSQGPEVWLADTSKVPPVQTKAANGSEPALSPDGLKVAYVDVNGQVVVLTTTVATAKPVRVTFDAVSPSHLTWSAEGSRLAYTTASGVEAVAANIPAGTSNNPATQISKMSGAPTFLAPHKDDLSLIEGSDPVVTALAESQSRWPTQVEPSQTAGPRLAATVVLAGTTTDLSSTLAGTQAVHNGPLLFTPGTSLDGNVGAEIQRVLGKVNKNGLAPTVTLLGGTEALSPSIEAAVQAMGYNTVRITGKDPAAMAVAAAVKPANVKAVFVVETNDVAGYAAAVSALPGGSQHAVLINDGGSLSAAVKAYLNATREAKVYAVGATISAAMSGTWPGKPASLKVTPYAATGDAAPTPTVLFTALSGAARSVVVVNASSPTDVIAAIGMARNFDAPVLAIDGKADVDPTVRDWLDKSSASIDRLIVVDSSGAISEALRAKIAVLVSGPLGYLPTTNPKAS